MDYAQQINFSEKLIKGRIAETIFEQILRDAGRFTVLAFGYAHTGDHGNYQAST